MHIYAVQPNDTSIYDIEIDTPQVTGKEVLLKVIRAGACHTDTHIREGGYDLGSRGMMKMTDRGTPYPLAMGHEVVGVVAEIGEDVTDVKVGETRLVYPWIGCGTCRECRNGNDNRCVKGQNLGVARNGGYAEYIHVRDEKYLLDIEGLDPSWAATLACSGLTAYSSVDQVLPLDADEPIVVCGAGGLGLTAISILSSLGHKNIIALDLSEKNLELARDMGATATLVSDQSPEERIAEVAKGQPAAFIDFVNNGITATLGFNVLRKAGTMVQVGLFGGEFVVPTALLALRMIQIRGSFVGSLVQLEGLIEIAKSGELPHIPIDERELNAKNVARALDDLTAGKVSGRIVLTS